MNATADVDSRPHLLAGALATRGNDVLVARSQHHDDVLTDRRPEGPWSIPVVRVREGEALVEAAVRAVRDMCGNDAIGGPFAGWYESIVGEPGAVSAHRVVMCFTVVVVDDGNPVPGDGVEEALWMPAWEVSELPLDDGLAELLSERGVIDTIA